MHVSQSSLLVPVWQQVVALSHASGKFDTMDDSNATLSHAVAISVQVHPSLRNLSSSPPRLRHPKRLHTPSLSVAGVLVMKLGQQMATSLPPRRQEIDVGKKKLDSLIAFVSNNVMDILFSSNAIDMSYCSNLGIDIMSKVSVIHGENVGYDDDSSIVPTTIASMLLLNSISIGIA